LTYFEIVSEITEVEIIAVGSKMRGLARLRKQFGKGRWRKLKGVATVRLKKLFEKSLKATKGRNVIAWGIAPGIDAGLSVKPCKGDINIPPLQGLMNNFVFGSCGVATGFLIAPLRGFSNSFLERQAVRSSCTGTRPTAWVRGN
jgi:hypothetical protein